MPVALMGPRVSKASGWKMWELGTCKYFADFPAAAPPELVEIEILVLLLLLSLLSSLELHI